jgi:hypothetical protein
MRTSRLLSALAISAGIAAGSAALAPVFAQGAKPASQEARNEMSIGQVYDKMTAAGYVNIDKIERERNAFEIKARDKNGARVKLYVDPQTGDIIEPRRQDRNRDRQAADGAPAK